VINVIKKFLQTAFLGTHMEIDQKILNSLFKEAEAFPEEGGSDIYYAGLAVLVGDMVRNLPRLPSELFNSVVSSAVKAGAFPYFDPSYSDKLPKGMAAKAAAGRPSIRILRQPDIIHEWTIGPGKRLFEGFNGKLKELVCKGKDSSYNKYIEKRLRTQEDLRNDIAITVLKTFFSANLVWYPLAVYVTQIIIKTPIEKYCKF